MFLQRTPLNIGVRLYFTDIYMKIGIISDIHEDAERLNIAIKALEKLGCDEFVCLGDISGFDERFYSFIYSRDFNYCLDLIKANCKIIIPGNHYLFHLKLLPEQNSVFTYPNDWFQLSLEKRKAESKGKVWLYEKEHTISNPNDYENIFSDFNSRKVVQYEELTILFSHSIFPDIAGVMTKKPRKKNDFFEHLDSVVTNSCHIGISGHLHPNGLLKVDRKKIYNPKFTYMEIPKDNTTQFIVPCIADGMQDNGYTILDTINFTIESLCFDLLS